MDWIETVSDYIARFYYKNKAPCLECIVQASCNKYYCGCQPFHKHNKKVSNLDDLVEAILEWTIVLSLGLIAIFILILIVLGFITFLKLI